MNFNFFMPTKVIMADDCIQKNTDLLREYGHKALVVTGANSAKICGALHDILRALENQGISYEIYDRIKSNPSIADVYEGADYAKEKGVDFVIGIGGGSPMDASKAIALLAAQEIREEELFTGKYGDKALPIIMIPTTAGTGSEVTPYSILTNDELQTKTSFSTPLIFPKIAFLDAKYTRSLPIETTINTALDALSHAIEGMLTIRATHGSNAIAIESMCRITKCIRQLSPSKALSAQGQLSIDVREKLLYSSMLAGIVITHTGTTVVHSMGYCLTYFKNVDHGRANGLILPSYLRFVAKNDPEIVKKILAAMELSSMDEFEAIFLKLLGERENITQKELESYTSIVVQAKNVKNSKVAPTREDIEHIFARSIQIID